MRPVGWEEFHGICKGLALAGERFGAEVVLAVGRGGYYAGALIGHLLRIDVYPVWLSRRVRDVVSYNEPRWIIEPPASIRGQRASALAMQGLQPDPSFVISAALPLAKGHRPNASPPTGQMARGQ